VTEELVIHGGKRKALRGWLIILMVVLAIAVSQFTGAVAVTVSDDNGGVGKLFIPEAVAVGCLFGIAIVLAQWWDDRSFFRVDGQRVSVRHGVGRVRGRTAWLEHDEPVNLHLEGNRGNEAVFIEQGDVRVRIGEARHVVPGESSQLRDWLHGHGFAIDRGWGTRL